MTKMFKVGDHVRFKPPGDQHVGWVWRVNGNGTYYVRTVPPIQLPPPFPDALCPACGQIDPAKARVLREHYNPFGSYGWDEESGDRLVLINDAGHEVP